MVDGIVTRDRRSTARSGSVGIFRVPNDPGDAPVPLPGWLRLLIEIILFAGAALVLSAARHPTSAWKFGIAPL